MADVPATARVTMLFEFEDYGWSESYFQTIPNGSLDNAIFKANVNALIVARMRLLSQIVSYLGCRTSIEGVFRDSRFYANGGAGFSFVAGFWKENPAPRDVALLFRLEAGPLKRRPLLLRGVPAGIVALTDDGDIRVDQYNWKYLGWQTQVQIWISALRGLPFLGHNAGNWQIVGPDAAILSVGYPAAPISVNVDGFSITVTTPIQMTQTGLVGGPPVTVGQPVIIKGARGYANVNGAWLIKTITLPAPPATGYEYSTYPKRLPPATPLVPAPNARIAFLSKIYTNIDTVQDERLSTRKSGRPFGQPRGRRSRRN